MGNLSLRPLLEAGKLRVGEKLLFSSSKSIGGQMEGTIQHVKPNYLILACTRTDKTPTLIGSIAMIQLQAENYTAQLELEVIQEQTVWPISLLGMLPISLKMNYKKDLPLIKPDYIINIPYKRMGAKPNEEKGEGVVLEFSPQTFVIGTDGYLAKGEFVKISFVVPKTKKEVSAMSKVVEKNFENGTAVVTLQITAIDEQQAKHIQEYYDKVGSKS
ncbi:PilZ domain-containing protein [Brevibacillus dissolubilis]|uniref:PilZ domain-containing protein n=1 Tax=Brevibacillus dissolubilis TaxID=1844116 RepID=UPI0011177DB4|nr:PilZ domain-containing protein [Brevibacillus dissolubilis]